MEDNNVHQLVFFTDTGKRVQQKGLARVRNIGGLVSDTAVAQQEALLAARKAAAPTGQGINRATSKRKTVTSSPTCGL